MSGNAKTFFAKKTQSSSGANDEEHKHAYTQNIKHNTCGSINNPVVDIVDFDKLVDGFLRNHRITLDALRKSDCLRQFGIFVKKLKLKLKKLKHS